MNGSKSPLLSKTFWLGIVLMVMAFFIPLLGTQYVQDNPAVMFTLLLVLGLTILFLRFCTYQPITWRQDRNTQNKVKCGPCNRFVQQKNGRNDDG